MVEVRIVHCLIALALTCLAPLEVAGNETVAIDSGAVEGARYQIAIPRNHNGKLLLYAPGYRPKEQPLTANLGIATGMNAALLKDGWMLAITSYRRNGWIIDDAMVDLDNLYGIIASKYGPPKRTVVLGSSMGGQIVVRLAERSGGEPDYDGYISVCAALGVAQEPDKRRLINFAPKGQILFLSNQDELADVTAYTIRSLASGFRPAIWGIVRDGHCNMLPGERLAAVLAMDAYLDTGELIPLHDATEYLEPPASVALHRDGWAYARIARMTSSLDTEFVPEDFSRLGIEKGERFLFSYEGFTSEPFYGTTYSDVEKGDWIAFHLATGYLRIARNFANAAESVGCTAGDTVRISKKP